MWYVHGLLSMLCFSGMLLLFKQLTRMGMSSPAILLFTYLFAFGVNLLYVLATRESVRTGMTALSLLAVGALLSFFGNFFFIKSMALAPNPGYSVAIENAKAIAVTVAAIFLFNSDFTALKAVGVLLCAAGMVFLAL